MNHDTCDIVASSKLVSASYVTQGRAALNAREKLVQSLISNRRLPATGWDEASIEMLLQVRSKNMRSLLSATTTPGMRRDGQQ